MAYSLHSLKLKIIISRSCKNFNSDEFLLDVRNIGVDCNVDYPNCLYTDLSEKVVRAIVPFLQSEEDASANISI